MKSEASDGPQFAETDNDLADYYQFAQSRISSAMLLEWDLLSFFLPPVTPSFLLPSFLSFLHPSLPSLFVCTSQKDWFICKVHFMKNKGSKVFTIKVAMNLVQGEQKEE